MNKVRYDPKQEIKANLNNPQVKKAISDAKKHMKNLQRNFFIN